jgi:SAM-dependent methyltransferase
MIDYDRIRNFYDRHGQRREDDPDFLGGTIESARGIARFRNRAEARHLSKVLKLEPGQRVLDLGAGTGRWSVYFAQRGARVTAVELAPSLARGAERNAARLGLDIDVRVGSIVDPPLAADELFDVVHIGNVLVYVDDADLPRVRERVRACCKPGGMLVLREPVDPDGPSEQADGDYHAIFRRPERYGELFARDFRLLYERTTVSHLIPRGQSTGSVVSNLRDGGATWKKPLVEHVLPLVGYVDYALLELEERVRRSKLQSLLGDPGVIQHFYIFALR